MRSTVNWQHNNTVIDAMVAAKRGRTVSVLLVVQVCLAWTRLQLQWAQTGSLAVLSALAGTAICGQ